MNNLDRLYNNDILYFTEKVVYNNVYFFPGSFNPIHDGHLEIISQFNLNIVAELSIDNVDKGRLSKEETQKRISQFEYYNIPYVISRCPSFVSKLAFAKKFVVGQDTFNRLIDPKYCNLDYLKFKMKNVDFVVFGRNQEEFKPDQFWLDRTKFIPFSNPISSTEIRNAANCSDNDNII